MSRREKEKSKSLDALSKFAYASGSTGAPAASKPATAPPAPRRPAPAPPPPSRAPPLPATDAERARRQKLEERKAKLEEERALRARREGELARGAKIDTSRWDPFNVPSSIRRTGFDRQEASTSQKIHDVLGDPREKAGRSKAKAKGKRQGGR